MNTRSLVFSMLAAAVVHPLLAQESRLRLNYDGLALQVSYETVEGKTYVLHTSHDLIDWEETGLSKNGDGLTAVHEVGPAEAVPKFFRLIVRDAVSEWAPSLSEMAEILVGSVQFSYSFTSPTRFAWNNEPGEWRYEKTGPNAGLIVLSYDEDGNDPGVYREELVLTFNSALAGDYLYYEYSYGRRTYTTWGTFTLG